MAIAVSLRGDFKASQLRAVARKTKDGRKHPPKAADPACLTANGALCGRRVFRD